MEDKVNLDIPKQSYGNPPLDRLYTIVGAGLLGLLLYLTAINLNVLKLWQLAILLFVFATIVMMTEVYLSTIRRLHESSVFNKSGVIYWLMNRRFLTSLFWFVAGMVLTYLTLLKMHFFSQLEWLLFFSTIPIFYLTYVTIARFLLNQSDRLHLFRYSIRWSRALMPLVMILLFSPMLWKEGTIEQIGDLKTAIDDRRQALYSQGGSAIVDESMFVYSSLLGVQDWAAERINRNSAIFIKLISIVNIFIMSLTVATMLSFFLISRVELRRIFVPPTEEIPPPAPEFSAVVHVSAMVTLLSAFIYMQCLALLETYIINDPTYRENRELVRQSFMTMVELIDGKPYRVGTLQLLGESNNAISFEIAENRNRFESYVDSSFQQMESNVDDFLDQYYTVTADISRLGFALAGTAESYLQSEFEKYVMTPEIIAGIASEYSKLVDSDITLLAQADEARRRILEQNEINLPSDKIIITTQVALPLSPISNVDGMSSSISQRAAGSVVAAALSAKILGKVASKTVFKLAAKALIKVTSAAITSAGAGAVTGTAILGPGIGTLIGAITGLLAGFAIDAVIIEGEEALHREDFKLEIIGVLRESKASFKSQYFPAN